MEDYYDRLAEDLVAYINSVPEEEFWNWAGPKSLLSQDFV